MPELEPPWPHAPAHQLSQCGTYLKEHHFRGRDRLGVLQRGLLTVTSDFGWALEAWAALSNHYHFVPTHRRRRTRRRACPWDGLARGLSAGRG